MNLDKRSWAGGAVLAGLAVLLSLGGWIYRRSGASSDLKIDAPLAVAATPGAKATPGPPMEFAAGVNAPASPAASATPTPAPTPPVITTIMVQVAGQVKNPGLYEMKPTDRIKKAIDAAGGLLPDADADALNLADYVRDADKYFVGKRAATPPAAAVVAPTAITHSDRAPVNAAAKAPPTGRVLGSKVPVAAMASKGAGGGASAASPAAKFKNPGEGVINLNTADLADLQRLPGVGPSTAEKILEKRKEIGSFADTSQLQDVKGIGPKKFAKMEPFLTVK